MDIFDLEAYSYELPAELIAQHPAEKRDESRLMVIHKHCDTEHKHFYDIIDYLSAGDTLVINETAVIPARIYGTREKTGAKIEILLLKQIGEKTWETLVRPGSRVRENQLLDLTKMKAIVLSKTPAGGRVLEFIYQGEFYALLDQIGEMPLPPYIREKQEDPERYQTVYATEKGSAAAPTAGLHFTTELLSAIEKKGVNIAKVLLHVGLGTFRPVEENDIRKHHMHSEYFKITADAAEKINSAKRNGKKVIAVGTTSMRVIESAADNSGRIQPYEGWTDIFIYPGYNFRITDGLVTNFHLPKSSLIMLVCAFLGYDRTMREYKEAVNRKYRFFSFGDAMLII